jgi:hypothetical protein
VNAGGPGYDCSSVELFSRYEVHCIAEKSSRSTYERCPIQKHYRTQPAHQETSMVSAERFLKSSRPLFRNDVAFEPAVLPRIDSSDYPEQTRLVAVLPPGYLD